MRQESQAAALLEIVLLSRDFEFGGRDEVEEPLEEALQDAGLGEVVGGGTGKESSNIDVEVRDAAAGLALVRKVLRDLGVARSTTINERVGDLVLLRAVWE